MAAPKPGQFNKPRNNNNWFKTSAQKFGPDFLRTMNADLMQRGAASLFRDLARGNINVEEHGNYFLDQQLLDNCIIAASTKFTLHSVNYAGVNMLVAASAQPPDPSVYAVLEHNKKSAAAYDVIVKGLTALHITRDLGHLVVMIANLRDFRYNI